jgi:small subunit ribosomal protein S9
MMNTSSSIIAILVLAVVISIAIGYLLLYRRKRGRNSRDEESETQEGKSVNRLEKTELPTIEEEINHEVLEEIAQEIGEVPPSDEDEGLLPPPEEIQRLRPIDIPWRKPHQTISLEPRVREGAPHHLKPEIICWEKGRSEWILAVELPEEICKNGEVEVTQNSSRLEQDTSRANCWRLEQAFGTITVNAAEDPIDLGKEGENYLLFKLRGEDRREGRLVKSPSSGEYLVVVPANWKITNAISVSPEQVNMESYQAYWHVFDPVDNRRMAFATPKGEKKIQSKSPRFRLIGSSLNDASYMGPLFVANPPQISAHDIVDWNDVGTIIIGEIGESGWRMEIPLTLDNAVQTLPTEVLERQIGWYFLRFYDKHDSLIESLDFRYVRGLETIKVPRPQPFPSEEKRHELACVEIMHESDCVIEPADIVSSDIRTECAEDRTVLPIPPNPAYDKTRWRISYGSGAKVEITILIERVWWNIGTENERPSTWKDQFETLLKENFSATSDVALWLRFPTHRWINKVKVDFQREQAREFPVAVTEQTICVPLRNIEVRDLHRDHFLQVWLERGGKPYHGVVAVVAGLRPDWRGYGRKKSAIAVAMMRKGTGEMEINGFSIPEYFQRAPSDANLYLQRLCGHDQIRGVLSQLDISFRVRGSSPNTKRQVMAVAHALAHALMKYQPDLTPMLKRFGGVRVSKSASVDKEGLLDESN